MKRFYKNGLKASLVAMFLMLGFSMSQADSPRFVVMEQFTNSSCNPCAAINPQYHAGLEARSSFVIPLVYHWYYPSKQDPMYQIDIPMNEERAKVYSVNGVPAASMNGSATTHPANHVNNGFAAFDNLKGQTSPIDIKVTRDNNSTSVNVKSSVALNNHTLHVVVVEHPVDYGMTFPNGESEFPWVPRQMLPNYNGTPLTLAAGEDKDFNFNYDISRALVPNNVYVVAFVQENSTKEILQGRADNSEEPLFVSASVENNYLKTADGGSTPFTVTLTNSNDFPVTGNATINTDNLLPGWTATLQGGNYSIDANSTVTISGEVSATTGTAGFVPIEVLVDVDDTQGMTGVESSLNLYSLSSATKSVYYFNTNGAQNLMISSLLATDLGEDMAFMAMNDELFAAYGPENFDLAVFSSDWDRRGAIAISFADEILDYIAAGKNVLMMSSVDLYNGITGPSATSTSKKLFADLGIGHGDPVQVAFQNGQQISLVPAQAAGVAGTEFEGLSLTLNQYNQQSHPYYTYYFDDIKIVDDKKAERLINMSVSQPAQKNFIGATGSVVGESKVIFMNFGYNLVMDPSKRAQLSTAIDAWFKNGGVEYDGALIAASTEELEFGTVNVGSSKEMTVTISNPGTQPLEVDDPSFFLTGGTDVFTVKDMSAFPATVQAGGSMDITVVFTPKAAGSISDDLELSTNVDGEETFYITVSGNGQEESSSPSISLSSSTIDFGNVVVDEKMTMPLTITNNGGANLVISSFNLIASGSPFTLANKPTAKITIEPSKTFELQVEFMSSEAGKFSNSINIMTNDPSNPTVTVTLSGDVIGSVDEINAVDYSLTATPNVFSGSTSLNLEAKASVSGSIELTLVDVAGNTVRNIYSGSLSSKTITLDASGLSAGKYYVIAKRGNTQTAMHVIVK